MDTQITEILGRNRLVDELLRSGLEVSFPARDRGIDLIAYTDLDSSLKRYVARPIQMKAASTSAFSIDRKYEKFPDLIIAYIWFLEDPPSTCSYALFYSEAIQVGEAMGWTKTASWQKGQYSTTEPSKRLLELIEPYRMDSNKWWEKVTGQQRPNTPLQPTNRRVSVAVGGK